MRERRDRRRVVVTLCEQRGGLLDERCACVACVRALRSVSAERVARFRARLDEEVRLAA